MKIGSKTVIVALCSCVAILTVVILLQHSTIRRFENNDKVLPNVISVDAVHEYNGLFFKYSFGLAQEKREKDSLYNRLGYIVVSAEDAVRISDIALKNTYSGDSTFKETRVIEYDDDNKLWVVKYRTNTWPSREATIIIDQYDGSVLFCEMPHG